MSKSLYNQSKLDPTLRADESTTKAAHILLLSLALFTALLALPLSLSAQEQRKFSSPNQAAAALFAAIQSNDTQALAAILGSDSHQLLSSGDPVADKNARAQFAREYEQMHRLAYDHQGRVVMYLGADNWPAPIPIVRRDGGWVFDTAAGKDALIYRRIGRNELFTITTLENLADAQSEYASAIHDGVRQYARYILSDPGKQNGLYWQTPAGAPPSPIGPLIADATSQGYNVQNRNSQTTRTPFHGYFYKVLTRQGKNAPGGAKNYIVNGRMTGGFAFLAWPAEYRSSGVMTFMINQDLVLVQKNLGPDTSALAHQIVEFNPDSTWDQVEPE
jgi:Protein of unknown function (DUF2950)